MKIVFGRKTTRIVQMAAIIVWKTSLYHFLSWLYYCFASKLAKHGLNTVLMCYQIGRDCWSRNLGFKAHCIMNSASSRAILALCLYQLVTRFCANFCSKFLSVLSFTLFPTTAAYISVVDQIQQIDHKKLLWQNQITSTDPDSSFWVFLSSLLITSWSSKADRVTNTWSIFA